MLEKELQENVRQLASVTGWLYYHTHRSDKSPAGFPDCVLVRGGVIIFAELKQENAQPSESQKEWLLQLSACTLKNRDVKVCLWRPSQWLDGTIENMLMKRREV